MGQECGYIAIVGALAAGAVVVYTPEIGVSLKALVEDVEFLKRRYESDTAGRSEGRIVIRYAGSQHHSRNALKIGCTGAKGLPRFTRPRSSATSSWKRVVNYSIRVPSIRGIPSRGVSFFSLLWLMKRLEVVL